MELMTIIFKESLEETIIFVLIMIEVKIMVSEHLLDILTTRVEETGMLMLTTTEEEIRITIELEQMLAILLAETTEESEMSMEMLIPKEIMGLEQV